MARLFRPIPVLLSLAALLGLAGDGIASARGPVLGLDLHGATRAAVAGIPARLAEIDPLTLRVLQGPAVELQGHVSPRTWSPDRTRLALARSTVPSLRVVDVRAMRRVGDIPLGSRGDVAALAWIAPSQLVAVVEDTLLTIDPGRRQVAARTPLQGRLLGHAAPATRLVLIVAPERGVGATRLVVVEPASTRELVLDRIDAGRDGERLVAPGLALAASGRRAWVVGSRAAAEVDLETLAVEYRDAPRSPASRGKGPFVGSVRTAVWIAPGRIAVSGGDRLDPTRASTSTGLLLIETETWEVHRLTAESPLVYVHADLLLTVAGDCGGRPGLTAYAADGRRLFHVCETHARGDVSFAAGRAYLGLDGERVAVVDLHTGAVVARPRTAGATPLAE